ncbi:hypothetical protein [Donghicola mangrovi]|uniref:Uncharacterized protein n=1 Tax=Donghicola mangrovi TaxID=2729614 RepID=A0A850Q515_9RHOB|nr:hypothetical protein [Donghicola mangrovi]NVO22158.1 hypothetical protein [Donghicola mangrovi]
MKQMRKALSTLTLSVALLTAGAVHPVQAAENDQALRTLAGIAALAGIALAVNNANRANEAEEQAQKYKEKYKNERDQHTQYQPYPVHDRWQQPAPQRWDYIQPPAHHSQRPQYQQPQRSKALPRSCLKVVDSPRGDQVIYGLSCLDNAGVRLRDLPNECFRSVRIKDGNVRGYEPRCLSKNGVELSRR